MKTDNKLESIIFHGSLLFLFCYFLQIFAIRNIITVPIGILFLVLLTIKQKKIRIDIETGLLFATIGIYFICKLGIKKAFISPAVYVVPIMYTLANYLACDIKEKKNDELLLNRVLMVMVAGVAIHGILNSYMFLRGELLDGNIRVWKDFWDGEFIYGTMQVLLFIPIFALTFIALIESRKKMFKSIGVLGITALYLLIALLSVTRSPVLILPIIFGFQFLMYCVWKKDTIRKSFTKRKVVIFGSVLVIAFVLLVGVLLLTSKGKLFLTAMGRDGGIFNNIRFKIQRSALQQLLSYPMGGNKMDHLGYGHTHNAWLDIADIGGIIPFVFFCIYTVLTIYEMICLCRNNKLSVETKLSFAGMFVGYFLFFTFEPCLDWSVYFMTPWVFLHGLVHGYIR